MRIRILDVRYPDPALKMNADPDPGYTVSGFSFENECGSGSWIYGIDL
jgi:hypothetical protein